MSLAANGGLIVIVLVHEVIDASNLLLFYFITQCVSFKPARMWRIPQTALRPQGSDPYVPAAVIEELRNEVDCHDVHGGHGQRC